PTLLQPLQHALELLRTAVQQRVLFDPSTSTRLFHIAMSDINHLEFLPLLMNRIEQQAPHVQVEVIRITGNTPHELEAGDVDLAIGFMPELEAGFYQQKLFDQSFACVVRTDH